MAYEPPGTGSAIKEPTIATRLVRLALYLAIGLVIAALIGLAAIYTPESVVRKLSGGWVWLILFTPLIFGYVARQYRHLWRRPSFWLTLSGLLALHLLAFTLLFQKFHVRPFWLMLVAAAEIGLISTALDAVLPESRHRASRHHRPGGPDELA